MFCIKDFFSKCDQIRSHVCHSHNQIWCHLLKKNLMKKTLIFCTVIISFALIEKRDLEQKQPPEVFYKKGVLRNFIELTGKHLYQSVFFNKVACLNKTLWRRCFPVNFVKFLRTRFLQNTSGRLLLQIKFAVTL